MKVLVAGKGFIGSGIVEALKQDHEVKTLDRTGADYNVDVTEEFSIEESFDVVFHTIGLAPGMSSPEAYRNVHVEGTRNILSGIETEKIVYISALKAGEVDHSFFHTKNEAEELIRESGLDYTVIRPSTVYGRGNKLMDIIRSAAPLRLFPDIRTETQPIHIDDLTDVLVRTVDGHSSALLELAGPEEMMVGQMAVKIYEEEGHRCILVPVPKLIQKTALRVIPLSGPFSSENINILRHQNTVEENDAERILGKLREI